MNTRHFNVRSILVGEAPKDVAIKVKGWVRTRRDSKAGISFIHLSDGSSFHPVQVVAPNTLSNYTDEVLKLTSGCAIEATGMVVPSPAKGQPFEMQASAINVIGWVDDPDTYPIQPKPHSLEFLREVAHLRPRTNVIGGWFSEGFDTRDLKEAKALHCGNAPNRDGLVTEVQTVKDAASQLAHPFCKGRVSAA
jgi:aspartyl/asparaginyl-tRNA synthetase